MDENDDIIKIKKEKEKEKRGERRKRDVRKTPKRKREPRKNVDMNEDSMDGNIIVAENVVSADEAEVEVAPTRAKRVCAIAVDLSSDSESKSCPAPAPISVSADCHDGGENIQSGVEVVMLDDELCETHTSVEPNGTADHVSDDVFVQNNFTHSVTNEEANRKDTEIRLFLCDNHATVLTGFGACTLVCARDEATAISMLDAWLSDNGLHTSKGHPYKLQEIVPYVDFVYIAGIRPPAATLQSDAGQACTITAPRSIDYAHTFIYRDVPIMPNCARPLMGAVVFACSHEDAGKALNTALHNKKLLPPMYQAKVVEELEDISDMLDGVIPLSIYMLG